MPASVRLSIGALALSVAATAWAAPGKTGTPEKVAPFRSGLELPKASRTALADFGNLPQRFEVNQGQFPSDVRYVARSNGYEMYLTDKESILVLYKGKGKEAKDGAEYTTLRMSIRGAEPAKGWQAGKVLPGVTNYFLGKDATKWHRNVPSYESVTAKSVRPGVDLVWYGKEKKLEYDLVVAPGVDAANLEVAWNGAQSMQVDAQGNLVLETLFGRVVQQRPYVYQMVNGKEVKIEARYSLRPNHAAAFELAQYDRSKPLVIDPAVLVYSTFLGATPSSGTSIKVDGAGSAYVLGQAASATFPFVNAYQTANANTTMFLAKFNPAGTALVYGTYLGGADQELPKDLAVDSTGAAYVMGDSYSRDFPVRNAYQATPASTTFAFADTVLTKFTPAGNDIVFSTYFGATGGTESFGLAVGPDNAPVIAVLQTGTAVITPALRVLNAATVRAVIVKFAATGSTLLWATQVGDITIRDVAVDASGVYFVGDNIASGTIYTPLAPPPSLTQNRPDDAVIGKLNAAGTALVYYTHFGGTGPDSLNAVVVDSTGALYAGGVTKSANLPLQSAVQTTLRGSQDGFVVKLAPAGNSIVYATYVGGSSDDLVRDVSVDSTGGLALVGTTGSTDIQMVDAVQPTAPAGTGLPPTGFTEVYLMKFSPAGSALTFSSYLGGQGGDFGGGIAAGANGDLYVTGSTDGVGFTTVNAFQSGTPGGQVAFVRKYRTGLAQGARVPTVSAVTPAAAASGTQQTFTFTYNDEDGGNDLGVVNVLIAPFLDGRNACYLAYDRPSNNLFLVNNVGDNVTAMVLNGSGSTSNSQCTIVGAGSSAVVTGNTLTLTLVIQFNATTFAGRKVLYMAARDAAQNNSGWQPAGVYGVATPLGTNPMVVSLSPASGTGTTATLTMTYRDATAGTNLQPNQFLINNALDGSNACYVAFVQAANQLYVVKDQGGDLVVPGITPGAASGFTENSQCRIDAVNSSRTVSGNTLTVTVQFTFKPGFNGRKIIYGGTQTLGGANSGWHAMGAWNIQ